MSGLTTFIKPAVGPISSGFGPRKAPTSGASTYHWGTDIGANNGSPVIASASGVVAFAGLAGGFGGLVRIDHAGPDETYYAHLSYIGVRYGQQVAQGQVIAASGGRPGQWGAGTSNGSHLHTEHRINGKAVDPVPYWSSTAGGTTIPIEPIEEEENPMKIIAPYGLPDRGVIAPGFGYAFPDEGQFSHFLNVWGLGSPQTVPVTIVGGPTQTAAWNRDVFNLLINMHQNRPSTAPAVDVKALAATLAPLLAGGANAEQIAAKVDAILKDDFAGVKAAIPTEFTITAKS